MQIIPNIQNYKINSNPYCYRRSNLTFTAMKKPQFNGIDYMIVEKFNAPIEKFNSYDDYQNWAKNKLLGILNNNDYKAKSQCATDERIERLNKWLTGVKDLPQSVQLLIITDITKDLNEYNDKLPPEFKCELLDKVLSNVDKNLKKEPKALYNIGKLYQEVLEESYGNNMDSEQKYSEWIVVPSKSDEPEKFWYNVAKLQALSCDTWCTKGYHAGIYLDKGSFHILKKNGTTVVGMRFENGKIAEIESFANNFTLPFQYYEDVVTYINKEGYDKNRGTKLELYKAQKIYNHVNKVKADLSEAIKNNDSQEIFEYFGIKVKKDKNGFLSLSEYKQPSKNFSYKDLGINENKLFEKVKYINGNADFTKSNLTKLKSLKAVYGKISYDNENVKPQIIKVIKNTLSTEIKNNNARTIFEYFGIKTSLKSNEICLSEYKQPFKNISYSELGIDEDKIFKDVGYIKGNADFKYSKLTSLHNLKYIGGSMNAIYSELSDLGKLKYVGENAAFINTQYITSLKNLEKVKGFISLDGSQIRDVGKLKYVGDDVYLNDYLKADDFSNVKIKGRFK